MVWLFSHAYSGASICAEDLNLHTPTMMSAAHRQTTAFQCLMMYENLDDAKKNPVFKTLLLIELKQLEILEVTLPVWDCC